MFSPIADVCSFHDTQINDVMLCDEGVVLLFKDGIYLTQNIEGKKTSSCEMKINIYNFDIHRPFQHIEIKKQFGGMIKEINFKTFSKMVTKDVFKVYLDYYCDISRSIKLEGMVNKFNLFLTVSDIKDINLTVNGKCVQ